MKKLLTSIGEEGSRVEIMYVDRNMELIGKLPKRDYEILLDAQGKSMYGVVNSGLEKHNEDFRPVLYERLSESGKQMIDSYLRGTDTFVLTKEQEEETKKDNRYVKNIYGIPLFTKDGNGVITANNNAVRKVGFPLGYCLSQDLASSIDYAKADVLYEFKSKEELVAEMTDLTVRTVGLKRGFETFVAENIVEVQLDMNGYTFSDAVNSENRSNEAGCATGMTYYYETLMIYDKYEEDIKDIQRQMIREGKNPYYHNEDPDFVKDGEVKKAYGFVLDKLERSSKEMDEKMQLVLPYRKKNYGIAKEILHEFDRENQRSRGSRSL